MSNSQNKKNEQQNNLCTTLTEQWRKGELEQGWYYVKGADGLIGMMSDYALYRVNLEYPDNEITLLAKMPTYEEWQRIFHCASKYEYEYTSCAMDYENLKQENQQLRKWCEEFNTLDVAKENQQLKELLKQSACYVYAARNSIHERFAGATPEQMEMLINQIDNAIGEKK